MSDIMPVVVVEELGVCTVDLVDAAGHIVAKVEIKMPYDPNRMYEVEGHKFFFNIHGYPQMA